MIPEGDQSKQIEHRKRGCHQLQMVGQEYWAERTGRKAAHFSCEAYEFNMCLVILIFSAQRCCSVLWECPRRPC